MTHNNHEEDSEIIYGLEPSWFAHSATLRIHGQDVDFDSLSRNLGLQPTYKHRKGEKRGVPSNFDAWHYQAPIDEEQPLEEHIMALWEVLKPHVGYLKSLQAQYTVDVVCGYRSNDQTAGFDVDHKCLELFTALEVPFSVSVITLE